MKRSFVLAAMLLLASVTRSWSADARPDRTADIAVVAQLLQRDKSFDEDELAAAQAALHRLERIARSLSDARFELEVAHIASLADNGHTFLLPGGWPQRYNRIPLRFVLLGDGLFVGSADDLNAGLIGARVEAIEGRSLQRLRRAWSGYQGGLSGWRDQFLYFFIESPEMLHAAGIGRDASSIRLRLRSRDGRRFNRTIKGSLDANAPGGMEAFLPPDRLVELARNPKTLVGMEPPLYLQEPNRQFRRARLSDGAYYLQFKSNSDFAGESISDFLATVRSDLKSAPPQRIIIDLRFDMGGDLNTTRQFMEDLPKMVAPGGRVFAITSGRTFSAGISSLGYLRQSGGDRVTVVGTPVGDRLEFWAETDTLSLPQTLATLLYATERHNYIDGCQRPDCHASIVRHPIRVTSLAPDMAVSPNLGDLLAGRDPAMDAIGRIP